MADLRVAMIRGINVGKANRIAMADLRQLVEGLGYGDVSTLLNSGNVVFTVPASNKADPGPRIETAMVETLGVSARVTTVSAKEIAAIIDQCPILDRVEDHSRFLITVLSDPADTKRLTELSKLDWSPDVWAIGKRVVYHWCPDGILASKLVAAIAKALGDRGTARNWATMLKLRAMLET